MFKREKWLFHSTVTLLTMTITERKKKPRRKRRKKQRKEGRQTDRKKLGKEGKGTKMYWLDLQATEAPFLCVKLRSPLDGGGRWCSPPTRSHLSWHSESGCSLRHPGRLQLGTMESKSIGRNVKVETVMTVLNNYVPVVSGTPRTLSSVLPATRYGILRFRVVTASFRETQSLERLKDLPRVIGLVRGRERIWSHTCLSALIFIRGLCGVGQAPTRKRKPPGRAGAPPPCSDPQVVLHAPLARWWSQPICLSTSPTRRAPCQWVGNTDSDPQ